MEIKFKKDDLLCKYPNDDILSGILSMTKTV
jgi:hypothetical protein